MKRRIRVFLSLVTVSVLLLTFTSCATTGDDAASDVSEPLVSEAASAADPADETPSPAATDTTETESTADGSTDEEAPPAAEGDAGTALSNTYVNALDINPNQIVFDDAVEDFLSAFGSADNTLDRLAPMLLSVANTAYETGRFFYTGDEPVDAEFE